VSNHAKGMKAEEQAVAMLAKAGFKLLNQRYKTKAGEIDVIVIMDNLLVFCEVKARKRVDEAAFSVTERMQKRIRQSAEIWLSEHEGYSGHDCRFDCIFITPVETHWLEDAF
jgi:putative endonuclease